MYVTACLNVWGFVVVVVAFFFTCASTKSSRLYLRSSGEAISRCIRIWRNEGRFLGLALLQHSGELTARRGF